MMNLSRAQLEPFRALHYFHENLNIHIKSSIAGIILLADTAGNSSNPRQIGELIRGAHPAWNSPPVHQLNLDLYKKIYCSVGAYAVVALFSALDDFLTSLEADISRYEAHGYPVTRQARRPDDEQGEPIESLYNRYAWSTNEVRPLIPVLKYFRLMRNCLAHRSSRASPAFSEHSKDRTFHTSIGGLLERTTVSAPAYEDNEEIFVDPTLAICCSDTIRTIAADCNRLCIALLGVDGLLLLACKNLKNSKCFTAAYKSPEAVLNLALTERYRVRVADRLEAPRQMQRLGIWKDFYRFFLLNYR